ncbi:MAG: hypothetical protein K8L99_14485 [Anaerolineae bacterium]|nr:hypothetical protein [Anaerolineae bacterium]
MQLTREINRLLFGLMTAFALVVLSASYWATVGPDTILQREDNPRLVEAEARLIRGDIYDRQNNLLATSIEQPNQHQQRSYPAPEVSSIVGYASQRYGVGGAEAAYNAILRGDTQPEDLQKAVLKEILQQPQEGTPIRLSIDLTLQQTVLEALEGHTGAVVVMAVPSGEILSLVSTPLYDPNTLDANWETLVSDPDKPFFNRALQGAYQPGGLLQTPLMAAALLEDEPLETLMPNATEPVVLPEVTINCAVRVPYEELTLREAYAFACPEPFAQLAEKFDSPTLEAILNTFHFDQSLTIPGFPQPETTTDSSESDTPTAPANVVESAMGQSTLTVSPLEIATMMAAIVNDGNAPQPNLLLATRAPDADTWQTVQSVRPTLPFSTARTARQLQDLMREAVAIGAASNAGRPNVDIGGHATLAYSGDESQAWFAGFATLPARRGIAIAIVLENSQDPGLAADIGGTVLAAAHDALLPTNNSAS